LRNLVGELKQMGHTIGTTEVEHGNDS
jgi:hypothetical protein